MKIMSFNTQHCQHFTEQRIDFAAMADAIRSVGADLVGLNEMRGAGEHPEYTDQVPRLAELTGLPYFYFAKALDITGKGPYGNAILSRYPLRSAVTVPIPDPSVRTYHGYYETRCLLKAELENGYRVLVTHFGLNPDEQKNAVDTVLCHLAPEKCILMGDFNVQPDNAVLEPIRARMRDAADLFATPLQSFPSDAPRVKIDYIFVTPDVDLTEADIPAIVASDHRPHTATLA